MILLMNLIIVKLLIWINMRLIMTLFSLWYNPIRQADEQEHKRHFTISLVIWAYKIRPHQISEGPQ